MEHHGAQKKRKRSAAHACCGGSWRRSGTRPWSVSLRGSHRGWSPNGGRTWQDAAWNAPHWRLLRRRVSLGARRVRTPLPGSPHGSLASGRELSTIRRKHGFPNPPGAAAPDRQEAVDPERYPKRYPKRSANVPIWVQVVQGARKPPNGEGKKIPKRSPQKTMYTKHCKTIPGEPKTIPPPKKSGSLAGATAPKPQGGRRARTIPKTIPKTIGKRTDLGSGRPGGRHASRNFSPFF